MNNFNLHTPTRILFGKGAIAGLREQIPHDARVLITYGGGSVKKTGVLDQVLDALKGMDVLEFGGIEPNPAYETLMNAVKLVREQKVTFLLAVGGGSVLDGTKFIAAAANYPENIDPWHILQTGGKEIKSAIPMGCVLTLPATGSESNAGAVISRKTTGDKQAFHSAHVQPVFAVLDPVYTYTLPSRQVANGVVDAFVHTVEQYVTKPVDAKIQDRFAEGIFADADRRWSESPERARKLRCARQRHVGGDSGAERFDRRWRTAGLGNAYAGPRTDCDARSGSRANTGYRPACTVE